MPLGPSICLALEPWHLLTAIVRLRQMTGQDSTWSTIRTRSTALCCAAFRGHARVPHVFCESLQGPGEGRPSAGRGHPLFVEVDRRRGGDSVSQRNMLRALVSSPARAACVTFSQEAANSTAGVKVYREPLSDCMRLRRHESKVQTPRWTLNRSGSHLHAGHSGVKKFTQCLCVCTLIARKSRALE